MKKKIWFAAIVAMSLTVGLGARILTGEEAGATSYSRTAASGDESALEETAERPWMHPAITVVVKVPAKAGQLSLSQSAGANRSTSGVAASGEAAEGPWVHPAVTVVVKVPAKPRGGETLGG